MEGSYNDVLGASSLNSVFLHAPGHSKTKQNKTPKKQNLLQAKFDQSIGNCNPYLVSINEFKLFLKNFLIF